MDAVNEGNPMHVDCEPSGLCASYCSFKDTCPHFADKECTEPVVSKEVIDAVERYYSAKMFESSLNKTVKVVKNEIMD